MYRFRQLCNMPWKWSQKFIDPLLDCSQFFFSLAFIVVALYLQESIISEGFRCPCKTVEDVGNECTGDKEKYLSNLTKIYSILFVVTPVIIPFVVVFLCTITWKCCTKITGLESIFQLILVVMVWIQVVLLNGNYYACFFTPLPYQVKNEVCLEVN